MKEYNRIPIVLSVKRSSSILEKEEERKVTAKQVKEQIEVYLKKGQKKEGEKQVIFLGNCYSFLPEDKQEELLQAAYEEKKEGKIDSIAITTSASGVTKEFLKRAKKYKVKTIELAFYSSNQYLLQRAGMEEIVEEMKKVSKKIKWAGFELGHCIKVGMPESTRIDELNTVKESRKLRPNLVRISPVIVRKETKLAQEYENESYEPLSMVQAVERCKELVYCYHKKRMKDIYVEMPIDLTKEQVVAGPFHTEFGQIVESNIWYDSIVNQIKKYNVKVKKVELMVNPSDANAAIGYGEENLKKLDELYDVVLEVIMDNKIKPGKSEMNIIETFQDFKQETEKEKVRK